MFLSLYLSNQPSIHVFCCPAIYPSTYLPIDPYPFLCLSINFQLSLYLVFLCLSYLSICLSVHLSLNISLPISLYKSLSLSLFIHLCICLSLFLFGCLHLSADLAIWHFLSIYIYKYIYIYISICLSIYLSVCLSIYLSIIEIYIFYIYSIYLPIYLSIYIYLYRSIYLSIYLSISIYLCIYLSIYLSIYHIYIYSIYILSIYLSIYIYLSISIYLFIYLYLSISIYIYLPICIYLSIFLSIYISIYLIYLSIYLYLSIYIFIYIYLPPSIYFHIYPVSVCICLNLSISSLPISIYLCLSVSISIYLYLSLSYLKRKKFARLSQVKVLSSKTMKFCETSSIFEIYNIKNQAILPSKKECWVQNWRPLHAGKVLRLPRKSEAKSYEVLHKSRKVILANSKIWCSKMQPLSGHQRPDLLTHLTHVPLALRLPHDMHLGRPSSNVPRLPSFLKLLQNPHVWRAIGRVQTSLRKPQKTTLERPKVVWTFGVFTMLTWKCASRHNSVHLCSPNMVFLTFWLQTVLRAATACTFWASQLPKVFRTCAVFIIFTFKFASRHNGAQFFISHLPRWLRTRRFSEPTSRPSGATKHWKNTVSNDFSTFSRALIFFLPTLSLLCLCPPLLLHLSILSEVWLLNFLCSANLIGKIMWHVKSPLRKRVLHPIVFRLTFVTCPSINPLWLLVIWLYYIYIYVFSFSRIVGWHLQLMWLCRSTHLNPFLHYCLPIY